MLLSNRYNFLYVHIAKTGGTSVRAALKSLQWKDPYYAAQFICSRLSRMTGHRIAAKLPRHAKIVGAQEMLPKEFFDGLFKFAFVRNPWDLQVSSYHHLKRERPHLLEGHESFEDFTRWKLDPERPYQYHLDTVITPQTDYLIDLHGTVLTNFLGRYEQLHEDFARICETLGVAPPELPHQRQATDRGKDYRSYYSDDLAERVGQYFRRDVEVLNYRFDPA
ncbi:sulfotransferase family 2 domain-containing protein [Algiphilus sp. W345]|uniref:Sulfotransferase family 2 domain-containing protein n=1 Tax=Banduia mediterranea TaxID=3075609 RepID=A0ABU2WMI9_9GAMM|nr:sulfotransferase family 2 domain-containing protein [Algiphilus sp. W345]MDT0499098.1 sulfotransferase family 2 domain-containing protein [Algiphilus sp. W345]